MTSEPWKKVEELYHAALEREPGERDAFLEKACAGDGGLLREVTSLLSADERAERFIARSTARRTPSSTARSRSKSCRKACLLAALNHPNVAAIHGLEECLGKRQSFRWPPSPSGA
jgi:hypothetical protein